MSNQSKINKLMVLALNVGGNENEASNAFLMARRMVLAGKGSILAGSTTEKIVYREKVVYRTTSEFKKECSQTIEISCGASKMMYMIRYTTEYAFKNNTRVRLQILPYGKIFFPTVQFIYEGSKRTCDELGNIINVIYALSDDELV